MIRFFTFMAGVNPCPCKPSEYDKHVMEGLSDFSLTKEEASSVCKILDEAQIELMTWSWGTGLCRAMSETSALSLIKGIKEKNKNSLKYCKLTKQQYYRLLYILKI